ncbi:unnamed protein product [Larinioides sclopetarius]|uniref:Transposase n=1 Tax=Larinioides sclopetarius TaxID=280406 RepID=A0AAV1YRR9_9ARAC
MTAGKDFIATFMQDCCLSPRTPEATSEVRLSAFNEVNIGKFFDTLKELRDKYRFRSADIYNVDETAFCRVPTRHPKVLSPQANRRVITAKSAERGTTVTGVCAMSASGNFIFAIFNFLRVRMHPAFMNGALSCSEGIA